MPSSSDPLANPYAPPAAEVAAPSSDYEGERRSVLLMLLLTIVTFGVYPIIWYLRRTPFLDSLTVDKKVGNLPWYSLSFLVATFGASLAHAHDLVRLTEVAGGILDLVVAFRVARILRSHFARTGRFIGVSGIGVFFFRTLYLQHVINKAADTPASPHALRQ
jgi:hypothetical protein